MSFVPRKFLKPSLMQWDGNKITDHNRSELSIDVERIQEKSRMANGTMRKYIVADKRSFSVSWQDVPHNKDFTVDGFWGKEEIESWFNTKTGLFVLTLNMGDGSIELYNVMFDQFNAEISKRGAYDFWKVSVQLEEV
jgi:hypothetical protein